MTEKEYGNIVDNKKLLEGIRRFVSNSSDLDRLVLHLTENEALELTKSLISQKLCGTGFKIAKVVRDLGKFNYYLEKEG